MKKSKPDPAETPEPPPRPRITYQIGTGGSVTVDPPKSDTAKTEPADTEENQNG